jgi:hypothetical protein
MRVQGSMSALYLTVMCIDGVMPEAGRWSSGNMSGREEGVLAQ